MTMTIGGDVYEGLLGNMAKIYQYYKSSNGYAEARAKIPSNIKSVVKTSYMTVDAANKLLSGASWRKITGW